MDDGYTDDQTEALELPGPDDELDDSVPGGAGARRGPRQAAEGVRIIGAEEAAAAIEAGQVAGRRPGDAPRFGDVPEPPSGPRPSLRFPGADPTAVAKPAVAEPPPRPVTSRHPAPQADAWEPGTEPAFGSDEAAVSPGRADPDRYAEPTVGMGSGDDRGRSGPQEDGLPGPHDYGLPVAEHEGLGGADEHQFWGTPAESADPVGGQRLSGYGTDDEGTGSTPLPHWTEPPSGEVARISPEAEAPADDDLRAWSSLSAGPRWRDQHTDWDEADFSDEMLGDAGGLRSEPAPAAGVDDYGYADEEPAPAPRRPERQAPDRRSPSSAGRLAATISAPPRDVTQSVITGAVALVVVLLASAIGPKALLVLVAAALVMASAELFGAMRVAGHHPATLLGVTSTAALSGAVYWRQVDGFNLVLPLFLIFAMLWYLTGVVKGRPLMGIAVTTLGFAYVGVLGSFAALLLTAPRNHGIGLLLGAVLTTSAYDAGAFFAGRIAGHTPLAPSISPGKTVEGMIGACAATLVAGMVVGQIGPWDLKRGILLALVVMIAAPLGDLCESMLKRDLGVKDMGAILPGHGGVLDRIDALLFVVPATYYLVRVLDFA
ncbi:MAG: phosphatidate cytidylyltransferase [Actinomycetota bacterium]|nr:phosphatidate cytidylyltransferase [Actinomycetota bacterium]